MNIAIDIIKENKIKDIEVISISKDKNRKYGNEKYTQKTRGFSFWIRMTLSFFSYNALGMKLTDLQ